MLCININMPLIEDLVTKEFPPRDIKVVWKLPISLFVKDLFPESGSSERQSLILTKETHPQISASEAMLAAFLLCRADLEIRPKHNKFVHAMGVRQTISDTCTCCLVF